LSGREKLIQCQRHGGPGGIRGCLPGTGGTGWADPRRSSSRRRLPVAPGARRKRVPARHFLSSPAGRCGQSGQARLQRPVSPCGPAGVLRSAPTECNPRRRTATRSRRRKSSSRVGQIAVPPFLFTEDEIFGASIGSGARLIGIEATTSGCAGGAQGSAKAGFADTDRDLTWLYNVIRVKSTGVGGGRSLTI